MTARYRFEGHAIVSADDMIANAAGDMPEVLHHPEDQKLFQAALDRAALIVLGRRSHEAAPNPHHRLRMVMTSGVADLDRTDEAWWWNPEGIGLEQALAEVVPGGGTIAIPGGQGAFDYFLRSGFDAFHLSRRAGARLPGGVPLFSQCRDGVTADDALADVGLVSDRPESLGSDVSLTIWRRASR